MDFAVSQLFHAFVCVQTTKQATSQHPLFTHCSPAFSCSPGGQKRDAAHSLGSIGTPVTRARGRRRRRARAPPRTALEQHRSLARTGAHSLFIGVVRARGRRKQGASEEQSLCALQSDDARAPSLILHSDRSRAGSLRCAVSVEGSGGAATRCRALFRGNLTSRASNMTRFLPPVKGTAGSFSFCSLVLVTRRVVFFRIGVLSTIRFDSIHSSINRRSFLETRQCVEVTAELSSSLQHFNVNVTSSYNATSYSEPLRSCSCIAVCGQTDALDTAGFGHD